MSSYLNWVGKWDRIDSLKTHSAVWHMLDVGACAKQLIQSSPLAQLPSDIQDAIIFLVILHDLGKISQSFKDQVPNKEKPGKSPDVNCYHWQLSFAHLLAMDEEIGTLISGDWRSRQYLYAAVAGHHGRVPDRGHLNKQKKAIGEEAAQDAKLFIHDLIKLFPNASLEAMPKRDSLKLSWLISGLTIMSDWMGSNSEWFSFIKPNQTVAEYWASAQLKAEHAVKETGSIPAEPATIDDWEAFIKKPHLPPMQLRPMQHAVSIVSLPNGQVLFFIEDSTGAGKTEAALILAHRMITAKKGKGIFFALPTMATSDAMFDRMCPVLERLFLNKPSPPSLALAHGKRDLSSAFQEVKNNYNNNTPDTGDAECAKWIADDRRLSLLAEIGVGTIDQALLGVLPTRFNSLRLSALARNILVVDEAHSYDSYMEKELEILLEFQARLGGSAIIMTATLPQVMRERYAAAFMKGLDVDTAETLETQNYPALSVVSREGMKSQAVDPVPANVRDIRVQRLNTKSEALEILKRYAGEGYSCLWVRNAVDDAIEAFDTLKSAGIKADLLHARFAMGDRRTIEEEVLKNFGSEGTERGGRVLIATQIVEASLDLDFDIIVSDIAPIGSLIQRAGRLWRHMDIRPLETRPMEQPTLFVLSPDPTVIKNDRWLHKTLDRGAFVYDLDIQWRTADVLFRKEEISAPDGLRPLIEAVHGKDLVPVPDCLEKTEMDNLGGSLSRRNIAKQNTINPRDAFFQDNMEYVAKDVVYPTRLGEKQITILLLKRDGDTLVPWVIEKDEPLENGTFPKSEAFSEVLMSKYRFEKLSDKLNKNKAINKEIENYRDVHWVHQKWKNEDFEKNLFIAVVNDDGAITSELSYNNIYGLIIHDKILS